MSMDMTEDMMEGMKPVDFKKEFDEKDDEVLGTLCGKYGASGVLAAIGECFHSRYLYHMEVGEVKKAEDWKQIADHLKEYGKLIYDFECNPENWP